MGRAEQNTSRALADLPADELQQYGRDLGLWLPEGMPREELVPLVRRRRALLDELDQEALLEICVWARRPVRRSASKEELAKEIASITRMRFEGLSQHGVVTLARLRGIETSEGEPVEQIIQRMRAAEPLWHLIRRKRRSFVGSMISKLAGISGQTEADEYRFLPEEKKPSLRQQIEDAGVVGGIAQSLRGAADDYVRHKMDEIEARIDHKLDEIDRRLSEWRDREVANRLRIIRITLIATILVAALSLGYSAVRAYLTGRASAPAGPTTVSEPVQRTGTSNTE
jgi:hypothetical protein